MQLPLLVIFLNKITLPDTLVWLKEQFAQLAPIRIFIAPGESDPYSEKSLYTLIRWPVIARVIYVVNTLVAESPRTMSLEIP